jgi:hypothetical protein
MSLANGALGVTMGASLAVSIIGQSLAQARGFPSEEPPHMPGSSTTPDRVTPRNIAPPYVAFRVIKRVGVRYKRFFAAQWLAYALRCQRFGDASRAGPHD